MFIWQVIDVEGKTHLGETDNYTDAYIKTNGLLKGKLKQDVIATSEVCSGQIMRIWDNAKLINEIRYK